MPSKHPRVPTCVRLVGLSAIALGFTLAVGCRDREGEKTTEQVPLRDVPRVKRGARVIFEKTAGEFLEATVLREQGEHLRVQTADGAQSLEVSRMDVYAISSAQPSTTPGSYAICGVERFAWLGCKVERVKNNEVVVLTADLEHHTLPRGRVLEATPLTRMNIEHSFARNQRRREFLVALHEAGRPRAPEGWTPSPRERVVARRNDDWFGAKIHELEDDGARVQWRGDGIVEKVGKGDLLPEPPYPGPLKRGDFAMLRPHADSEPWVYVRVRANTEQYKVEDVKGDVLQVGKVSLIPIRPD